MSRLIRQEHYRERFAAVVAIPAVVSGVVPTRWRSD